ncbi:hypothetical protein LWC35_17915 [Pseudonocardia kujensis]|uniref:PD-(D/E)XK nuclease domain-containing protein n=1 Tax=Pseudonocardia kujensis TaxID=1128675 RepID=UPI001E5C34C5|nr:hypothetical protein [Pseudonocardia kujensis]MCE0764770.1 hypothetical protein [Pseudonocardia kujensis]
MSAFGHTFRNILTGLADDLISLEREGAIYSNFAIRDEDGEFSGEFARYRIEFYPAEIFQYVEAHLAYQQYSEEYERTGDFAAAVLAISNPKYQRRVVEYGDYGNGRLKDGGRIDNRGCLASFIGDELEALTCGLRPERYQLVDALPDVEQLERLAVDPPSELLLNALGVVALAARRLGDRSHGRPAWVIENEYDVQDLVEVVLRPMFSDLVREEWTPKRAGSAKRIDLVVPSLGAVIECKIVRSKQHARQVADELRVDFETYHDYPGCRHLYAYVFDPKRLIVDSEQFVTDLDGPREKRGHRFTVNVIVGF